MPFGGPELPDLLCEHDRRTDSGGNGVSYQGMRLPLPVLIHRHCLTKVRVRVHRYTDGDVAAFR